MSFFVSLTWQLFDDTKFCIQGNEKSLQRWLDHELEVMVNVHEVRYEYEKQCQVYVSLRSQCCAGIKDYFCGGKFSFIWLLVSSSAEEQHWQKSCLS